MIEHIVEVSISSRTSEGG